MVNLRDIHWYMLLVQYLELRDTLMVVSQLVMQLEKMRASQEICTCGIDRVYPVRGQVGT